MGLFHYDLRYLPALLLSKPTADMTGILCKPIFLLFNFRFAQRRWEKPLCMLNLHFVGTGRVRGIYEGHPPSDHTQAFLHALLHLHHFHIPCRHQDFSSKISLSVITVDFGLLPTSSDGTSVFTFCFSTSLEPNFFVPVFFKFLAFSCAFFFWVVFGFHLLDAHTSLFLP